MVADQSFKTKPDPSASWIKMKSSPLKEGILYSKRSTAFVFQRVLFWCYTHKQVLFCSPQYSVLSCEAALAYLWGSRALMHNQGFAWRPCHILSFCCTRVVSFCKMIHTHSTVCLPHIFFSSFLWGVDRLHFAFTRPHTAFTAGCESCEARAP